MYRVNAAFCHVWCSFLACSDVAFHFRTGVKGIENQDGSVSDSLSLFALKDLAALVKPHVSAEDYDEVRRAVAAQLAEFHPEDPVWWK